MRPVSLLLHDVVGAASGGDRIPGPPPRWGRAGLRTTYAPQGVTTHNVHVGISLDVSKVKVWVRT